MGPGTLFKAKPPEIACLQHTESGDLCRLWGALDAIDSLTALAEHFVGHHGLYHAEGAQRFPWGTPFTHWDGFLGLLMLLLQQKLRSQSVIVLLAIGTRYCRDPHEGVTCMPVPGQFDKTYTISKSSVYLMPTSQQKIASQGDAKKSPCQSFLL